jgi:NAD(P)-dependent dehydrogenase (short-subunit alcohol dehydrogenase family)
MTFTCAQVLLIAALVARLWGLASANPTPSSKVTASSIANVAAYISDRPETDALLDQTNANNLVLEGAFIDTQTALPHLRAGGRDAVVNVGGVTAHTGARKRAHDFSGDGSPSTASYRA